MDKEAQVIPIRRRDEEFVSPIVVFDEDIWSKVEEYSRELGVTPEVWMKRALAMMITIQDLTQKEHAEIIVRKPVGKILHHTEEFRLRPRT